MKVDKDVQIEKSIWAERLMKKFAERTALRSNEQIPSNRYLWTDAFAVLNFLALHKRDGKGSYVDLAQSLIEEVHQQLGKYALDDDRKGWISGLSLEEGNNHPTVAGLRIGKQMLERDKDQPYDAYLEWDRDGQYFHYNVKWIKALLRAAKSLDEDDYLRHAKELSLASFNFVYEDKGHPNMYWKMSIDLSRPQVASRGAHDPLEGLIIALETDQYITDPAQKEKHHKYIEQLKEMCKQENWQTSDALGIGGLLPLIIRVNSLADQHDLPESVQPQRLLEDAELSLNYLLDTFDPNEKAIKRLAFRECGLSLGLRIFIAYQHELEDVSNLILHPAVIRLADEIEDFWLDKPNQEVKSFKNHLNINEVSLASSLLAASEPQFFI